MTKTMRATPVATGHGPRMSDQLGGSIGSEYTHTPGRPKNWRAMVRVTPKNCSKPLIGDGAGNE